MLIYSRILYLFQYIYPFDTTSLYYIRRRISSNVWFIFICYLLVVFYWLSCFIHISFDDTLASINQYKVTPTNRDILWTYKTYLIYCLYDNLMGVWCRSNDCDDLPRQQFHLLRNMSSKPRNIFTCHISVRLKTKNVTGECVAFLCYSYIAIPLPVAIIIAGVPIYIWIKKDDPAWCRQMFRCCWAGSRRMPN